MTLRLEPELRKRLDGLAKAQRRSRSFVASEAIRECVAVNEWQSVSWLDISVSYQHGFSHDIY
jgi:predicted transcriptional regulator